MQIDDGDFYEIWGNPIALSGGITAAPASGSSGSAGDFIELPIELTAAQKWSIAGRGTGAVGENGVLFAGGLSGNHALTVDLAERPAVYLAANTEVGPLTIDGTNTTGPGVFNGFAALLGSQLNSNDGNAVNISHIFFIGSGAVGPLVSTSAEVEVGSGGYPAERIEAASATFDSTSELAFQVTGAGTAAGSDYSQLTSSGSVELGGASVSLHVGPPSEGAPCPSLSPGEQYTLVSTPGELQGEFANAPEGTEIQIKFAKSCAQVVEFLKITYNRTGANHTVTGTVIAGPSSTTTLSVVPLNVATDQGVTLRASVNASSGYPSGTVAFSDNGTAIAGCANQPVSSSGAATCETSFASSSSPEHLSAAFTPGTGVNLKASASSIYELTVAKGPASTILEVSDTAPAIGSSVTYTTNVLSLEAGPARPSGTVEFLDSGTPIAGCASQTLSAGGSASCQVSYSAAGTHNITALYLGDVNFIGDSSSSMQTITVQALLPSMEIQETQASTQPTHVSLVAANVPVRGNGSASLKLDCTSGGPCEGKLTLSVKQMVKKHGRQTPHVVTIGSADFSISTDKIESVTIHLNARGRALLHAGHGRLAARLEIEQAFGGTQTKTVHLVERPHTLRTGAGNEIHG